MDQPACTFTLVSLTFSPFLGRVQHNGHNIQEYHVVQAFAALQRALDPVLDFLMRRNKAVTHSESTEQMARELKGYLDRSVTLYA